MRVLRAEREEEELSPSLADLSVALLRLDLGEQREHATGAKINPWYRQYEEPACNTRMVGAPKR